MPYILGLVIAVVIIIYLMGLTRTKSTNFNESFNEGWRVTRTLLKYTGILLTLLIIGGIIYYFVDENNRRKSVDKQLENYRKEEEARMAKEDSLDFAKQNDLTQFPATKENPFGKANTKKYLIWEFDSNHYVNSRYPNFKQNPYIIGSMKYEYWIKDSLSYSDSLKD
ncbi:hypothetical protein [Cyclobacterium plantarum]|uniref:hypothetical protein n=1 Tax=Cyclobacterium plantarum TaxID=2716263 RepID=UPI003F725DFE